MHYFKSILKIYFEILLWSIPFLFLFSHPAPLVEEDYFRLSKNKPLKSEEKKWILNSNKIIRK